MSRQKVHMNTLLQFIRLHKYFLWGLFAIVLYLFPVIIRGADAPIASWDHMDSNIVWNMLTSKAIFSNPFDTDAVIDSLVGGMPLNSFNLVSLFTTLLYALFPPIVAYFIDFTLIHIIAYLSMYILLRKYVIPSEKYKWVSTGVAVAFAFLPFYISGISIAGLPLVCYSFLSIRSKGFKLLNTSCLVLYVLYSNLSWVGIFVISLLGLYAIIDLIFTKRFKLFLRSLVYLIVMSVMYLLINWRLMYSMLFDSTYISSRVEYVFGTSFLESLSRVISLPTGEHTPSVPYIPFILFVLAVILIIVFTIKSFKNGNRTTHKKLESFFINPTCTQKLLILGVACLVICILSFLDFWSVTNSIKAMILPSLATLQFRYYWLLPLIIYLIFAVSICVLDKFGLKTLVRVALILQIILLFASPLATSASTPTGGLANLYDNEHSFNDFYSSDLFASIQNDIGLNQSSYRVASIGLHPAIAQYNGFYTLDGYASNYPLEYKHKFREIIADELNKSEKWKNYFDNWGGRCYIFVNNIDIDVNKGSNQTITDLSLNYKKMYDMGGRYIISALPINVDTPELYPIGHYTSNTSAYDIYVYGVYSP